VLTGHADVSIAVKVMKAGAVDFIEKPFERAHLLAAIDSAFTRLEGKDRKASSAEEAARAIARLTPRERDVLDGLARGLPNKSIAYDLNISARTVEIHRANMMAKLGVRSLSDALRIAFAAELGGGQTEPVPPWRPAESEGRIAPGKPDDIRSNT
jgi:two-component system, LuxR family, response regulator FixJ